MVLVDILGAVSSIVLLLTSLRLLEIGDRAELSVRAACALVVGAGSAWSLAIATSPNHQLHPAHALLLFSGACWVIQAVFRHSRSPRKHPNRRRTDFGELDALPSGDQS